MKERRKIVFCFVCVLFSLILNACSVIKEKDVNTFETTSKLNTKGIEKNDSKSAREDFEREDKYWKFLLSEIALSATKDNKDYYKSSPVFWFKLCKTAGLLREEEVEYSYIYYVSKKDLDEYILLELFSDIEECMEDYQEFKDDIPDKSLIIGSDFGGGMILLVTVENDDFSKGIYYYDHSHFFEASNSENNTYFICDTFNEFIDILRNTILE